MLAKIVCFKVIIYEMGIAIIAEFILAECGDKTAVFKSGDNSTTLTVADCFERVGSWDMIGLGQTGFIKKDTFAWNATHTHENGKDITAKQFYTFMYELPVSGSDVTLPDDESIVLLAATAVTDKADFRCAAELYDSLEKRPFDYKLTKEELLKSRPAGTEKLLQLFLQRRKSLTIQVLKLSGTFQIADLFSEVRRLGEK